ncbi:Regulator of nonsense transcripts UPF3 [Platanthera guangdongensis]|uniref:Regulator of nonsense transcripts UPF3 n=1 Tax=Platanthera guangdongensis TaxID=2320717 RepID=A0ABR2MUT6_9ASPA
MQDVISQIRSSQGSGSFKQIPRSEVPGRIIRSILSNKDRHQVLTSQSDPLSINGNTEKDKCTPRPPVPQLNLKGSLHISGDDADGKSFVDELFDPNELLASTGDNKHEKRLRNKDRPDRGVWAPLRRSYNSNGRGTNLLSANETPVCHEIKHDTPIGNRIPESKGHHGGGRGNHNLDNGAHRNVGRRGSAHLSKELDSLKSATEGKPPKRGPPGYGSHEVSCLFSGNTFMSIDDFIHRFSRYLFPVFTEASVGSEVRFCFVIALEDLGTKLSMEASPSPGGRAAWRSLFGSLPARNLDLDGPDSMVPGS